MKGLKDNWIGFLGVLVVISIICAFMSRSISTKADKSYVDSQIKYVIETVSLPLNDISFKLDTIIKQNKP